MYKFYDSTREFNFLDIHDFMHMMLRQYAFRLNVVGVCKETFIGINVGLNLTQINICTCNALLIEGKITE